MMEELLQNGPEHLLRELAPRVLAVLTRRFRDFALAEDAVQEALLAAAMKWPHDGMPQNPFGWLIQVASRRMLDFLRQDEARREREGQVAAEATRLDWDGHSDADSTGDDTLELFFMCCDPALSASSAIALTLRAVGGLTTAEIARAFFVPEATMAQRISRAKATIKASNVRFALPTSSERKERLNAILRVLYLIFNEGYMSSGGPRAQRVELSDEGIRLARCLYALIPKEAEVAGLLALMLLTDARKAARVGPDEELVALDKQDRTLWNQAQIAEGVALLTATLGRAAIGEYQLQAAIAAVHDEARQPEDTDWPQILTLYELMTRMSNNPMVTLNRAIAVAMVHGPTKGLEILKVLDDDTRMKEHYRFDAVRGHLLEIAGDFPAALAYYERAAGRTASVPEQRYLRLQIARLADAIHADSMSRRR